MLIFIEVHLLILNECSSLHYEKGQATLVWYYACRLIDENIEVMKEDFGSFLEKLSAIEYGQLPFYVLNYTYETSKRSLKLEQSL